MAHISVTNNFSNLPELHAHLDSLSLCGPERLRPGWDDYFMVSLILGSLESLSYWDVAVGIARGVKV